VAARNVSHKIEAASPSNLGSGSRGKTKGDYKDGCKDEFTQHLTFSGNGWSAVTSHYRA
jgi:hypothetical protein